MIDRLFVYGTLKPGESRWPSLAAFTRGRGSAAAVSGTLYDSGRGWPAAVFASGSGAQVPGIVVSLEHDLLDAALARLDEIEGVDRGLFHRVVVDVDGRQCWAYHWPGETAALTVIASWPV